MTSAILDAAATLLQLEGPDAVTIRKVAAHASVAPMSVYNHFGDKSGVVEALFRRGFAELEHAMATAAATPDPIEALVASGFAYRDFAAANPATYQVMFTKAIKGFTPSPEAEVQAAGAFAQLVAIVDRCVAAGAIATVDPARAAQHLWSMVHGYVSLVHAGITAVAVDPSDFEDYLRVALAGLVAVTTNP